MGPISATILGCIIFLAMAVLLYLAQADKLGDNTRIAVFAVLGLLPAGMYCGYKSYMPEDAPHFSGPEIAAQSGKKGKKKNPFGGGGDDGGDDAADEAGNDKGGPIDDGSGSDNGASGKATPVSVAKALPPEAFNVGDDFQDCLECPAMVVVPAGWYTMGTSQKDATSPDYEKPQRRMKIARRLGVGRFEITVGQYEAFVKATNHSSASQCHVADRPRRATYAAPGFPQDAGHPVVCVTWHDANSYVEWLAAKIGKPYRLLSAAEWEYIARAGTNSFYSFGDDLTEPDANFDMRKKGTIPIGSYQTNAFKIADAHGNAAEWVQDCWSDSLEVLSETAKALESGDGCSFRVVKGGSWRDRASDLRSAARKPQRPEIASDTVGFRVARAVNNGPAVARNGQ